MFAPRNPTPTIALIAALALAACADDDSTGPERDLTRQDAEVVAEFTAGLGAVDFALMDAGGASDTIQRHREFSHTRDCPDGGMVAMSGERTSTLDTETRIVSTTWESVHSQDACSFTRTRGDRQVAVTLDGSVTTQGSATFQLPETRGESRTLLSFSATRVGQTTTTVGDRTRTCDIDVTQTYDPSSDTFTIAGTVCGRTVSITRPAHRTRGG